MKSHFRVWAIRRYRRYASIRMGRALNHLKRVGRLEAV
jgi:hypothetical protein